MVFQLQKVLNADEIQTLRSLILDGGQLEDGARTAGWAARPVKHNEQLARGARLDTLRSQVRRCLDRHPMFQPYTQARSITRILASRYTQGMKYGQHVDDALMAGRRSDLSFTLFLSEPNTYEGGELTLDLPGETLGIKLPAGDAVIYPTGALHQVSEVTAGERICAVGWVRSLVRRADHREILFDLDQTAKGLFSQHGKSRELDTVLKTKSNLLRLWADD